MPFVFLIGGIVLVVIALKGTNSNAAALLKSEFTGSNNFVVWVAAIAILGALGFVKPIRPIANGLLLLVLLVIVLNNKGDFFGKFNQAIRNPTAPPQPAQSPVNPSSLPSNPYTGEFFPGGTQSVPNIGLTPNAPGLIPGMVPGA